MVLTGRSFFPVSSFDDPFEFESKTITSAVKTFFRNLPEPIMTFKLHASFIEAASESRFN
jgi:hypothetical protein